MNSKFFTYKGYPLIRCGNQLYYGYMSDPYVIFIQILETTEINGENITSKVRIVKINTNEKNPLKAFVKNTECECGLYEALDIAKVWLNKDT